MITLTDSMKQLSSNLDGYKVSEKDDTADVVSDFVPNPPGRILFILFVAFAFIVQCYAIF